MVERKTLVTSSAYVSLILGFLSIYATGILDPLNRYVFLEYTLPQWIFMIMVVLGLSYVIGELLVSGNVKDTLKNTAQFISQISDMEEGESEQFLKDVLGQTKSKIKEDVFGDKEIPGLSQLNQMGLGKQVNLTKKEVEEKLKSIKIDPNQVKQILSKLKTYWGKFVSMTGLDKLTLIGKMAIIFTLAPIIILAVDLVLRNFMEIVLDTIINLWTVAFFLLPISTYLIVAKKKRNAHIALYSSIISNLIVSLLMMVIVFNDGLKELSVFGYLPAFTENFLISGFVAGIFGSIIINSLKYKLFPKLKVYKLFEKEGSNEIIVFKKVDGEYVPTLIKAVVYPNRIEMLKDEELKTIHSKLNLSEYLYGDLLLVAIDETFEDVIPVPIPQISADFNFSPELAELVNTTSAFIDSSIFRSKDILNKIKEISSSDEDALRDFIENDFAKFKKRFLDLDIPIDTFQKIVKVNLAKRYHRPVTKKVIIKGQKQAVVSSMLDTGAEISLISERLANKIGAKPVSKVSISGIEDGMVHAPMVHITITIDGKEAPIEAAIFPIDKQIGKDLLLDQSVYHWANEQKIVFI